MYGIILYNVCDVMFAKISSVLTVQIEQKNNKIFYDTTVLLAESFFVWNNDLSLNSNLIHPMANSMKNYYYYYISICTNLLYLQQSYLHGFQISNLYSWRICRISNK
jgi:hypothetical protein